jgi:hypothetical protein
MGYLYNVARNEENVLDVISRRLLCSKRTFRAYFTVLAIDGQEFIVERAFLDYMKLKDEILAQEQSRIVIPAGVIL